MSEDKLILYMPFNEQNGALKTYDYSNNRLVGIVENASFEAGKAGNCIHFDGSGKCEIEKQVLELNKPFTICGYLKVFEPTKQIIIVLNFSGINKYIEILIGVDVNKWYYFSFVRNSNLIIIYLNGQEIERIEIPSEYGDPIGISINQDNYLTNLGNGCIEELKIYQRALTQDEILKQLDDIKQLVFYIDGKEFKNEFGVFVKKTKGIADGLRLKEPVKYDWFDYHGEAVDLSSPIYDVREIQLECFIVCKGGKIAFMQAVKKFIDQFTTPHNDNTNNHTNGEIVSKGLHRLLIDIQPIKPLIYEVYLPDGAEVDKEWNDLEMIGTFTLKLREPEPVKRVLKYLRANEKTKTVTINLSSKKLLNIYWGDGSVNLDITGDDRTITHVYNQNGDYFIVITGVIDEISKFDTNAIVVWNKL